MPLSKISHVSEADHRLVTQAVAAAEARTSGEIVTVITDLSDDYHDVALIWCSAIGLLALAAYALMPGFYMAILDSLSGGWLHDLQPGEYLALLVMLVSLKWIGSYLFLLWMPLRLALTPRAVKAKRVRDRAIDLFRVGTDAKTVGRTGVLLFLSLREHRADIIADRAIAEQVAPDVWGAAMAALIDQVREGRPGQGMAAAVAQMGIVLAEHFPKGSENANELPDRLIEL